MAKRWRLGGTSPAATGWWPATGGVVTASSTSCWRAGSVIVFCEVKTRRSNAYGSPAEAVTPAKQARIRRLAVRWLHDTDTRAASLRFDVVGVIADHVEVIEAAF